MEKYDIVILGAGPGGYTLAAILSNNGKNVALIERKHFGGTCVNEGCISTKTLVKSAKVYESVNKAEEFGISASNITFNLSDIQRRRIENKNILNTAIKNSLEKANVTIIMGEGSIIDKNTIEVNEKQIKADYIVLATGSKNRELLIEGYNESKEKGIIIDSTKAMSLDKIPTSLLIVGSGPVALEFAYFYSTFGSKVTIIDNSKFMNNFDISLQNNVKDYLLSKNIDVLENIKISKIKDNRVFYENESGEVLFTEAEKILSAVGRIANIESFKNLNLELNRNKTVKVNKNMQTSIDNIYAIGDLTGIMMLSTISYKTADIVAKHLLNIDSNDIVDVKQVPWSVYLNPEFAGVGYTEQELITNNIKYKSLIINPSSLPRAHADNLDKKHGFIKFLISEETNKILGAFLFIEGAHLIINEIALAISNNITFDKLQEYPFTHPTVAEAIYYLSKNYVFSKKIIK
ncbi:dihydrolipoyl dehydrogenase [Metamycoplasma spumans]|uniref:dihydrolipoyl dehydrogenase n=1 Tax=Metamycoplasma spumans TaxID=92406 RepID=UPI0034DD0411